MTEPTVLRYAAFADRPEWGNPAGVVLSASALTAAEMQTIARDVGYSETAFVTSPIDANGMSVRYFAPEGEVDFCGHATVATAAAVGLTLGHRDFALSTRAGTILASAGHDGANLTGSFVSAPTSSASLGPESVHLLLDLLGWSESDLDPGFPPGVGFGGNHHPVLVARDPDRLAHLDYDFEALRDQCRSRGWVTIQLIAPAGPGHWRSRNPFPWGGVFEDPATGSAAAAFSGYLRSLGLAHPGDHFTITQGVEMGRQSRISVDVMSEAARITGAATPIRDFAP